MNNRYERLRCNNNSNPQRQSIGKRITTGLIILSLYALVFSISIQGASAGTNSKFYLTIGTQGGYGLIVDSVTLSNPNPTPGESITATVKWRATACPTCIVKANAFGDWNKQEIARFHDGSNTGGTNTFTFTAPGSAGNYNLRLIWAYDIGAFSNYDSTNLPSPSQASAWGNSASGILDVPYSVSVSSAYIKVTSPNGGETWKIGSTYDITWTSQNILGNVEIRIDRPGLSQRIAYSAPNTGKYTWTIGNDVEARSDWKVVVTYYNPSGSDVWDTSDQPFTITQVPVTPSPSLISPSNGATLDYTPTFQWSSVTGSNLYQWDLSERSDFVSIAATWQTTQTSISPAQVGTLTSGKTYYWRVAAFNSQNVKGSYSSVWSFTYSKIIVPELTVKISSLSKSKFTHNEQIYLNAEITGGKSPYQVTATSNKDGTLTSGSTTSSNFDYGSSGRLSIGTHIITFKVTDAAGKTASDSVTITIDDVISSIKITSPNSGETWKIGSTYDITWTSQNVPGNVEIRIDGSPGITKTLAYSAPNTGKYTWTIGNDVEARSDWKVVVTYYNPSGADVWDTSDNAFTITSDGQSFSITFARLSGLRDDLVRSGKENSVEFGIDTTYPQGTKFDISLDLYKGTTKIKQLIKDGTGYWWGSSSYLSQGFTFPSDLQSVDYYIRVTVKKDGVVVGTKDTSIFNIGNNKFLFTEAKVTSSAAKCGDKITLNVGFSSQGYNSVYLEALLYKGEKYTSKLYAQDLKLDNNPASISVILPSDLTYGNYKVQLKANERITEGTITRIADIFTSEFLITCGGADVIEVTGVVKDKNSGKGIPNAYVTLFASQGSGIERVIADSNGKYSIKTSDRSFAGDAKIKVSAEGYNINEVDARLSFGTNKIDIELVINEPWEESKKWTRFKTVTIDKKEYTFNTIGTYPQISKLILRDKFGNKVNDPEIAGKALVELASQLYATPQESILSPVTMDNTKTTPGLAISHVESKHSGLEIIDIINPGSYVSSAIDAIFPPESNPEKEVGDVIFKAVHHHIPTTPSENMIIFASTAVAFSALEIKETGLRPDIKEITLKDIGESIGQDAVIELHNRGAIDQNDINENKKIYDLFIREEKKEELILQKLKIVRNILLKSGYSESDLPIKGLNEAINRQENLMKDVNTIELVMLGSEAVDSVYSALKGSPGAIANKLVQEAVKITLNKAGITAANTIASMVGGAFMGIDLGKAIAGVDYSKYHFEQSMAALELAFAIDEAKTVVNDYSKVSSFEKSILYSFGKELVGVGYAEGAEGKAGFLFGAGQAVYQDVSFGRKAAKEMYRQAELSNSWIDLFSKYDGNFELDVKTPEIKVKRYYNGSILKNVNVKAAEGWWEDWVVDVGATVTVYYLPGEAQPYVAVVDPVMIKDGKIYRDTGRLKLEMTVTPSSGSPIRTTDMNGDGVYGDSVYYTYSDIPKNIEILLELTHGDNSKNKGSIILPIETNTSIMDVIQDFKQTIVEFIDQVKQWVS